MQLFPLHCERGDNVRLERGPTFTVGQRITFLSEHHMRDWLAKAVRVTWEEKTYSLEWHGPRWLCIFPQVVTHIWHREGFGEAVS